MVVSCKRQVTVALATAAIFLSWLLPATVVGDPAIKRADTVENWEDELKVFAEARRKLLGKVRKTLSDKKEREEIARQNDPEAVVEMTADERKRYFLAHSTIRELFRDGDEVSSELGDHLREKEGVTSGKSATSSYAEGFPSARTIIEMQPHSAERIVFWGTSCDSLRMQRLAGALLYDLDGEEIAKVRLDLAIKSISENEKLGKDRKEKWLANLTAIRKLFDEKDAFDGRRH